MSLKSSNEVKKKLSDIESERLKEKEQKQIMEADKIEFERIQELKPEDTESNSDDDWLKLIASFKKKFPDRKLEDDNKLVFDSAEEAEAFLAKAAEDKLSFFAVQVVNGKPIDNYAFSCGTGTLYKGKLADIISTMEKDVSEKPEHAARLSKEIDYLKGYQATLSAQQQQTTAFKTILNENKKESTPEPSSKGMTP